MPNHLLVRIKREARWTTFASIGAMVLMMVVAVMNFSTLVSALIGISNPPEGVCCTNTSVLCSVLVGIGGRSSCTAFSMPVGSGIGDPDDCAGSARHVVLGVAWTCQNMVFP